MPHQPVQWTHEKAFQLDALMSLETEITKLQNCTGVNCSYLRCGRLIPTRTEEKRMERSGWQAAAKQNWPQTSPAGTPLDWHLLDAVPDTEWLNPRIATLGCEYDTMSARVDPRGLIKALTRALGDLVQIREHTPVAKLKNGGAEIVLSDGTELSPARVIVTAGYNTFELLQPVTGFRLGRGVKGQAALMKPTRFFSPNSQILYYAGTYVIAHENGLVAIGSTSESKYSDPNSTDQKLDGLIARATELCPILEGAQMVERWAGIRPNAVGRHPMIGALPEAPRTIVCTGGFKISFAIAHKMADVALNFVTGANPWLPDLFKVPAHYARTELRLKG